MNMKKIGLMVVLALPVAALLYAVAYLYLYYRATSTLAALEHELQPVAQMSHGAVRVRPFGGIAIDDLDFVLLDTGTAIQIQRIAVRSASPFWMPLSTDLRRMALVIARKRLLVELTGLRLRREDLPSIAESGTASRTDSAGVGGRLLTSLCGPDAGAQNLGYLDRILPSDLFMSLRIQMEDGPGGGADILSVGVNLQQVGELQARVIADVRRLDAASDGIDDSAIRQVEIRSRLEERFLSVAKQVCASMRGTSTASLDRLLLDDADRIFGDVLGLVPSDALLGALSDYLSGAEIRVAFDPTAFEVIGRYAAEDAADVLGLEVYVDGERVLEPGFRAPRAPGEAVDAGAADSDALAQPGDKIGYDLVARCIGCLVTVRLKDGRERQGIADALDGTTLYIKWYQQAYLRDPKRSAVRKGTVTALVPRVDIDWIRFEAPPP
jgi:hypothetical protein